MAQSKTIFRSITTIKSIGINVLDKQMKMASYEPFTAGMIFE